MASSTAQDHCRHHLVRYPQKLRPNYPRTRTGCMTCRQRKKKCDELKPRCVACNRNKLDCIWPLPSLPKGTFSGRMGKTGLAKALDCSSDGESSSHQTLSDLDEDSAYSKSSPSRHWRDQRRGNLDHPYEASHDGSRLEPVILWAQRLGSFFSTERAAFLTPISHILLEHYLSETGTLLAASPVRSNPFITYIVPLASIDDLLMHTVLALSGSHLSFKQPGNLQIQRATFLHCSLVLRSLRTAFQDVCSGNTSTSKLLRLLIILIILCHFEVSSPPSQNMQLVDTQKLSLPSRSSPET
jgi:hypothetical protein